MWNGLGVTGSDCWGVQGNDASIICQDVFCWIIWAHFLMVRREHTAICIWLLYETLGICKARWETQKGLTKEDVFRCAMCFQSVYPSSPETWTQPQQQSWCNQSSTIAHLSLPLHSLWENRNVKCPASAASGKNHSMFTNHIWNTGSQLWRNPSWPFSAELEAALLAASAFQMSVSATPPTFCAPTSVLWRLSRHLPQLHTKLSTPALLGNADSFFSC